MLKLQTVSRRKTHSAVVPGLQSNAASIVAMLSHRLFQEGKRTRSEHVQECLLIMWNTRPIQVCLCGVRLRTVSSTILACGVVVSDSSICLLLATKLAAP